MKSLLRRAIANPPCRQCLPSNLKEIAEEYRELTKHFPKLEGFVKLSIELEESHTTMIKLTHQTLSGMKSSIEETLEPSSLLTKLLEKVVEDVLPVFR